MPRKTNQVTVELEIQRASQQRGERAALPFPVAVKETAPVEYYYDSHPTKEDLMSESPAHSNLVRYLMNVLEWHFRGEDWAVLDNIGIYETTNLKEKPKAPDISLFSNVSLTEAELSAMRSWQRLVANRPAPTVAFEISSKDTWREDIKSHLKPKIYGELGVAEYFAYDPNEPTLWRDKRKWTGTRLLGWRYNNKIAVEIKPDARGWLWSEKLNLWLGEAEYYLRLYDETGNLLLTEGEAERTAKLAEQQARTKAEAEAQRNKVELEALLEKLRRQGIDPDKL